MSPLISNFINLNRSSLFFVNLANVLSISLKPWYAKANSWCRDPLIFKVPRIHGSVIERASITSLPDPWKILEEVLERL